MKKNIFLGVNTKTKTCCKLSCSVSFDDLVSSELESDDFVHDATNWSGQDDIKRTLDIIKMRRTNKKIILKEPLIFYGSDYDHGHSYSWKFEVDEIYELEDGVESIDSSNWYFL